jgi:hypothetical protein
MARELQLPTAMIGPADVSRLKRELDTFDERQRQSDLRSKADKKKKTLEPGKLLFDFATLNNCDITNADQRAQLVTDIEAVVKSAPIVTMSFAVDPSAPFMSTLVEWFRTSVHPHVLIRIGLQPNVAAGCVLRTSSKIYDFSLRSKFTEQRPLLVTKLHDLTRAETVRHNLAAPSVEAPVGASDE